VPCVTGKRQYRTQLDAKIVLALRIRKIGKNEQRRVKNERRSYRCPHCGWWHLTAQR
jgi:predicted SprT family Zn-dependent metalloprotease